MSREPKYSYIPIGSRWLVIRWERSGNGVLGDKVAEFPSREEARRECFRLNGWSYKEPETAKKVIYKSNLGWDDMPNWLKHVVVVNIRPYMDAEVENAMETLNKIRGEVVESLKLIKPKVPIMLEVREDEGESVFFIARTGRVLVSVYVK